MATRKKSTAAAKTGRLANARTHNPDGGSPQSEGSATDPVNVALQRNPIIPTSDQALWVAIRKRSDAINFNRYATFINNLLCEESETNSQENSGDHGTPSVKDRIENIKRRPTIKGVDSFKLLKLATEAFLIFECGVYDPDLIENEAQEQEESIRLGRNVDAATITRMLETYLSGQPDGGVLPYIDRIVTQILSLPVEEGVADDPLPYCEHVLTSRVTCPSMIELIWSYWHEEGMLVQTMNAVTWRFQNRRRGSQDPLANLELDPLRPLNNFLWGFLQDERNLLSIQRRAYEYDHHYGFTLLGKAVDPLQAADSRTQFIQAFHTLLHKTSMFYHEDDDTTIVADAFPLLNALRETHIVLAEGAHNQYGDLPWTSRVEMLVSQWILARSEMKEFIRGRYMVPYQEPWMGAVDDMKRLQGWNDVSITHFHELATCGEKILLSIRFGDWIDTNIGDQARNWSHYWRPEIQRYIHAYHAVTGVDLSAANNNDVNAVQNRFAKPGVLLQEKLAQRHRLNRGRAVGNRQGQLPAQIQQQEWQLGYSSRKRLPRPR